MFRFALIAVCLAAAVPPPGALAQPGGGGGGGGGGGQGGGGASSSEPDCKTRVRTVSPQICPSTRQRVRICTQGGQERTVQPLNCV